MLNVFTSLVNFIFSPFSAYDMYERNNPDEARRLMLVIASFSS